MKRAPGKASEDDRKWFKAHRTRSHRICFSLPGEHVPTPGRTCLTVVRQVEPGFRLRLGLTLPDGIMPPRFDEAYAHALFDRLMMAVEQGDYHPDLGDFDEFACRYENTGRARQ